MPMRRLTFSLRTLLTLVTCVGLVLTWIAYSLHWIQVRREGRLQNERWTVIESSASPPAPWSLWLFGEAGVTQVLVRAPAERSREECVRAARVFPEATIREGWILADR